MTELRTRRVALGKSISDVSHEARVNTSCLSWVEKKKAAASANMRASIAAFFDVPETELFDTNGFAL